MSESYPNLNDPSTPTSSSTSSIHVERQRAGRSNHLLNSNSSNGPHHRNPNSNPNPNRTNRSLITPTSITRTSPLSHSGISPLELERAPLNPALNIDDANDQDDVHVVRSNTNMASQLLPTTDIQTARRRISYNSGSLTNDATVASESGETQSQSQAQNTMGPATNSTTVTTNTVPKSEPESNSKNQENDISKFDSRLFPSLFHRLSRFLQRILVVLDTILYHFLEDPLRTRLLHFCTNVIMHRLLTLLQIILRESLNSIVIVSIFLYIVVIRLVLQRIIIAKTKLLIKMVWRCGKKVVQKLVRKWKLKRSQWQVKSSQSQSKSQESQSRKQQLLGSETVTVEELSDAQTGSSEESGPESGGTASLTTVTGEVQTMIIDSEIKSNLSSDINSNTTHTQSLRDSEFEQYVRDQADNSENNQTVFEANNLVQTESEITSQVASQTDSQGSDDTFFFDLSLQDFSNTPPLKELLGRILLVLILLISAILIPWVIFITIGVLVNYGITFFRFKVALPVCDAILVSDWDLQQQQGGSMMTQNNLNKLFTPGTESESQSWTPEQQQQQYYNSNPNNYNSNVTQQQQTRIIWNVDNNMKSYWSPRVGNHHNRAGGGLSILFEILVNFITYVSLESIGWNTVSTHNDSNTTVGPGTYQDNHNDNIYHSMGFLTKRSQHYQQRNMNNGNYPNYNQYSTDPGQGDISNDNNIFTTISSVINLTGHLQHHNLTVLEKFRLYIKILVLVFFTGIFTWLTLDYGLSCPFSITNLILSKIPDNIKAALFEKDSQFMKGLEFSESKAETCLEISQDLSLRELNTYSGRQYRIQFLEKQVKELRRLATLAQTVATSDSESTNNEISVDRLCCVCLDEPRSVLLIPCNHLCICSTCLHNLRAPRCPLCNMRVQRYLDKIYT